MTYALSAALQGAVYRRLAGSKMIADLVGDAIYDAVPPGTVAATYISLGPEDVRDASDMTAAGATHDFIVSVVTNEPGFAQAKTVAAAVSDVLLNDPPEPERGYLVAIWFLRATARRVDKANLRRIDMTFRARVGN